MKTFRIIGLMSGTSLDGLDLADVKFSQSSDGRWTFELLNSKTIEYSSEFKKELANAVNLSGEQLALLSVRLGNYYALQVLNCIKLWEIDKNDIDAISSHGQTVFHQPSNGFTLQIGNGPELSIKTGIKSIVDFRTKDVALGGNGAPLVPIADHLLFTQMAEGFLNLGGFANLSFQNQEWKSFDVCPVNIVLNDLMQSFDLDYDFNGNIGRSAPVDEKGLSALNNLAFYTKEGPKSLGWEWVRDEVLPILKNNPDVKIQLGTFYQHCATQIGGALNKHNISSVLITGGGAFNSFLIEKINTLYNGEIVLPSKSIIEFKEAIAFAFLGLLRLENKINIYSSVTGAKKDSCSGSIYIP
ncbi:MAG: anhydro-N-acetylmuramic acid kinase [Brumimicrobium sp.]